METRSVDTPSRSTVSTSTSTTSTRSMSAPSTNKPSFSFLGLPAEVRQMVYREFFRDTKFQIHNTAADMSKSSNGKCWGSKMNVHTNLFSTAKIVYQEATPLFLKEADFCICCPECWYRDPKHRFELPHVDNLTVETVEDLRFYNQCQMICVVAPALNQRFERHEEMKTLICNISIRVTDLRSKHSTNVLQQVLIMHEGEPHKTFLINALDNVQNFRVRLTLPRDFEARFNILFTKDKCLRQAETAEYHCQSRIEKLTGYLDEHNIRLCKPIQVPPETDPVIRAVWKQRGSWFFSLEGDSCMCEPCEATTGAFIDRYVQEQEGNNSG